MASKTGKAKSGRKSVVSHPLFPVVAALWFGALGGLGSLAIRLQVLEELARASKIDLLIPAAGPPFGVTARILLAVCLTGIGGIIGGVIARRIARPKPAKRKRRRPATSAATSAATPAMNLRPRDAHPDAPARKPISAHEELFAAAITNAPAIAEEALATRRRSLALPEAPPTDFVDFAPLPGEDGLLPYDDGAHGVEALDMSGFEPDVLPAEELVPIAAAAPEPFSFTPSPQPAEAVIAAPEIVATEPGNHATQGPANREELASTELMDRLAEALRRRRQARAASVEVAPALAAAAAVPAELHSLPRLLPLAAQPAASSAVEPTPIIVPAIMLPLALRPIDFGSLDDDAAVEQPPMRHLAMPGNASAPVNGNAVDGLAASLALSQESAQGLPSLSPDDDPEPTDSDDEAYSSLLEMDVLPSPPRQDFIRIEENEATSEAIEPVVIFPGHSVGERSAMAAVALHDRARADTDTPSSEVASTAYARDPEETERALRAALTSLQRMSGAA